MINIKENEELSILNHSCAHLMAQAVKHLYPNALFWVGPVVEGGFYYDIDLGDEVIKEEDLLRIEKEMKKISKDGKRIVRREKLHVGDILFINGLKIVWMRTFIVVNNPGGGVKVQGLNLYSEQVVSDNTKYSPVTEEESCIDLYKEDDYFSHTPRLRTVFEDETIVIDAPPGNQAPEEDMPFLLTIGTSLTMAASAIFMMYNNIVNLYTGKSTVVSAVPAILLSTLMIFGCLVMPRLVKRYQKKNLFQY